MLNTLYRGLIVIMQEEEGKEEMSEDPSGGKISSQLNKRFSRFPKEQHLIRPFRGYVLPLTGNVDTEKEDDDDDNDDEVSLS